MVGYVPERFLLDRKYTGSNLTVLNSIKRGNQGVAEFEIMNYRRLINGLEIKWKTEYPKKVKLHSWQIQMGRISLGYHCIIL